MESATDPFDLKRFVEAQRAVYGDVVGELRGGRKRSHWMWFVFPQLCGLGGSPMAARYGIASLQEARAYLHHDLLGPRLRECTRLVNEVQGRSITQIFGSPDDLKLRSSMTLFALATDDHQDFIALLEKYYGGEQDPLTLARCKDQTGAKPGRESATRSLRRSRHPPPLTTGRPTRR
jgi:uncharacterized protein (DUF1810 family)